VGDIAYKRSLLILEPASIATKKHKKKQPQKGAKGTKISSDLPCFIPLSYLCALCAFLWADSFVLPGKLKIDNSPVHG
jgi:hypothetical protein